MLGVYDVFAMARVRGYARGYEVDPERSARTSHLSAMAKVRCVLSAMAKSPRCHGKYERVRAGGYGVDPGGSAYTSHLSTVSFGWTFFLSTRLFFFVSKNITRHRSQTRGDATAAINGGRVGDATTTKKQTGSVHTQEKYRLPCAHTRKISFTLHTHTRKISFNVRAHKKNIV